MSIYTPTQQKISGRFPDSQGGLPSMIMSIHQYGMKMTLVNFSQSLPVRGRGLGPTNAFFAIRMQSLYSNEVLMHQSKNNL